MVPEVTPWRGHIQYINLGNAIEKLVVGAHTGPGRTDGGGAGQRLLNPWLPDETHLCLLVRFSVGVGKQLALWDRDVHIDLW